MTDSVDDMKPIFDKWYELEDARDTMQEEARIASEKYDRGEITQEEFNRAKQDAQKALKEWQEYRDNHADVLLAQSKD